MNARRKMDKTRNTDIRQEIVLAGLKQYEVAKKLDLREDGLSRKLRYELSQEEKEKIYSAIEDLKKEKLQAQLKPIRQDPPEKIPMPQIGEEVGARGKWCTTEAWPHNVYCSVCYKIFVQSHWTIWEDGSLPRNFCPNCGADMRGDDNG